MVVIVIVLCIKNPILLLFLIFFDFSLHFRLLDQQLAVPLSELLVLGSHLLHAGLVGQGAEAVQVLPQVLVLLLDDVHVFKLLLETSVLLVDLVVVGLLETLLQCLIVYY